MGWGHRGRGEHTTIDGRDLKPVYLPIQLLAWCVLVAKTKPYQQPNRARPAQTSVSVLIRGGGAWASAREGTTHYFLGPPHHIKNYSFGRPLLKFLFVRSLVCLFVSLHSYSSENRSRSFESNSFALALTRHEALLDKGLI